MSVCSNRPAYHAIVASAVIALDINVEGAGVTSIVVIIQKWLCQYTYIGPLIALIIYKKVERY